jgi:hypothetical protein
MERIVDRSELLSDASPPPSSPSADQVRGLDRFEFVDRKPENDGDAQFNSEAELEFCLFAPSAASQVQAKATVSKIRLDTPDPADLTPSFVVPNRNMNYYFTGSLDFDERLNFEAAAISGQDVIARSHSHRPGSAYEWRVLRVNPTKKHLLALAKYNAVYPEPDAGTKPSKRTRPGKSYRLKVRAKQAAERVQQEESKMAAEAREAAEREKRTRRNREKKMKKKNREKAKKAGPAADAASEGEESQPG